ncbi:MAG: hypothetical protein ACRD3O_19410 [Terriglobia bacterium]
MRSWGTASTGLGDKRLDRAQQRLLIAARELLDLLYDSTTPAGIAVLGHELVHVGQYREGMNWLEYLWSTRHGYANSKYEIPAYAMQARIEQDLEKAHSKGCPACKK